MYFIKLHLARIISSARIIFLPNVNVSAISSELVMNYGTIQHIVPGMLQNSKVYAHWVPDVLFEEHKALRMKGIFMFQVSLQTLMEKNCRIWLNGQ